jgi:hypothetical protein
MTEDHKKFKFSLGQSDNLIFINAEHHKELHVSIAHGFGHETVMFCDR